MNRFLVVFFISLLLVVTQGLAEDIVCYRVSTTSSEDWDIAVNGVTFVRHRPTGFGLCMYGGSINRVVSNGVNVISFLRNEKKASTSAKNSKVSLEIDFVYDYEGQHVYDQTIPLLRTEGFPGTNLFFNVDREVSRYPRSGFNLSASHSSDFWLFIGCIALYLFFVNLYGFIMVVNDRRYAREQMIRIPPARFIGNAFLGGGVGVLLGVAIKRHDMDRKYPFVIIPGLIIIQILLVVFLFCPLGAKVRKRIMPRKPALYLPAAYDNATDFLKSLKRQDPDVK